MIVDEQQQQTNERQTNNKQKSFKSSVFQWIEIE